MITVTKPFLPAQEDYFNLLKQAWQRNWLTNNGPLVQELETELKEYLRVDNLLFTSNGTSGLQLSLKALDIKGEVITTPFSYIATTSVLVWEGCKPVFVDIDVETLNIDPSLIEEKITDKTTAIVATHVFGNPCHVGVINEIATRHNLKVIYDAAHAFGVTYNGEPVVNFGDASILSFHATKLFHTIEGGGVVAKDSKVQKKLWFMRNFGHNGEDDFYCVGINAKNSEFHAAMGLVNLTYVDKIIKHRKSMYEYYSYKLEGLNARTQKLTDKEGYNHSYYPIVFDSHEAMMNAKIRMNDNNIYPRRYFHPVLSSLNYVEKQLTPVATDISSKILCLPMYDTLIVKEIKLICKLLLNK